MGVSKALEAKLEKVRGLPTPPRIAMQIIAAAEDPDISLAKVAEVVTSDPVISAKIMRMANSAAYNMRGSCNTLRRALLTLGLDATLVIALSFSLVVSLKRDKTAGLDHDYFWRRSLLSATAASALGKALNRQDCEALFLTALLQDIGMLALDKCQPDLYSQKPELLYDHSALAEFEIEQLECSHADVSQWLLNRWQLPAILVEAVGSSHDELTAIDDDFSRCVALSGPLADVWLSSDWTQSFRELVAMAVDGLDIDEMQLGALLNNLRDRIPETEAMFEKDLVNHESSLFMLEEARELLMERGVQGIIADAKQAPDGEIVSPVTLLRLQHWAQLHGALTKEFAEASRTDQNAGVIIAGISGLDHIRETHGTEPADRLLRETARAMLSNSGSRVIGQHSRNEIVLWLGGCNYDGVQLAGRRILKEFLQVQKAFAGEHNIQASLALGIAAMDTEHHYETVENLVAAAQAALERARFGNFATPDELKTPARTS